MSVNPYTLVRRITVLAVGLTVGVATVLAANVAPANASRRAIAPRTAPGRTSFRWAKTASAWGISPIQLSFAPKIADTCGVADWSISYFDGTSMQMFTKATPTRTISPPKQTGRRAGPRLR